jgi:hypothetical protein
LRAQLGPLPLDALLGLTALLAAAVVSCCVRGPVALAVAAHLTLAAAAGLGVGAAIVVGVCVIRAAARGHRRRTASSAAHLRSSTIATPWPEPTQIPRQP